MAQSVGKLVAILGLDAAEYTRGLTKAEADAKRFSQEFAGIGRAAGVGIGLAVTAAVAAAAAIDNLVKQAGQFKDIEERTGASAEAMASFSVSAAVAGVSMQSVADFSVKLSKNLAGVDDESKAAGAALAALGIPIKEFKALDPAAQIDALAKALAQFDDIAGGKAAAIEALAKGGSQLLPFLKELESAGGRQVILTQRQIELADEYADKQAKARAEINLLAQAAATQFLPAFNAITNAAKEYIAELIGMDNAGKKLRDSSAIVDFANEAVRALAFIGDSADSIGRIFRVVGNVIGASAAQIGALVDGDLKRYNAIQEDASRTIDGIIAKQTVRARLEKNISEQARNDALRSVEDRGFTPPRRRVDFKGAESAPKSIKSAIDEAERYLESLLKTQQATVDLTAEETARIAILDIELKTGKEINADLKERIIFSASMVDLIKQEKAAAQEAKRAAEEDARARKHMADEAFRAVEAARRDAQGIREGNESLKEQLILLRDGEDALFKYTQAKLAAAAAEREHVAGIAEATGQSPALIQALKDQAQALKERAALLADTKAAQEFAASQKRLADDLNRLFDSAGSSLLDFVSGTKSAKDAFRDFAKSIERDLSQMALAFLKNQFLNGGQGNGGSLFDIFGKFLQSGFGSGGGFSGGFDGGFSGGGFGEHFASGGVSRGGGAWVGEQGREWVDLPAGARVHSAGESRSMGDNVIHIHQTIMPGANTRAHREQALSAFTAAAGAARRR